MAARPHPTYEDLLGQADRLTPTDKLRLLEGLATSLRKEIDAPSHHSILELRGLGKEIWQGIDAQDYVDHERASWNG
jgi:hypothetical protein